MLTLDYISLSHFNLLSLPGQNLLPGVKFIHFDFHKECSKMRWYNLNILMDKLKDDLDSWSYFSKDNQGTYFKSAIALSHNFNESNDLRFFNVSKTCCLN